MLQNGEEANRLGPWIGIWWDDGKVCVALTEPLERGAASGAWIDSNLEHWREWPRIAHRFGKTAEDEYFEVPRGRVLFNRKTGVACIR